MTRLIGVALTVAVLRLVVIWSGWAEGSLLADDAYYYFTIAHHLAEGHGATFDGLVPTNGFHPLWEMLLVPFFALFRDGPFAPIRTALSFSLLLDLGTAALLARVAGRVAGSSVAQAAGLLWLLDPVPFFLGLRGMEASLSALLTVAVLDTGLLSRRAGRMALLLGLAGLTRIDNLVVLTPAVLVLVSRWPGTRRLRAAGVVVGGAALLMAPWFAWSWLRVGTLWQSSARMKWLAPDLFGALPDRWDPIAQMLSSAGHALFAPWLVPLRFVTGEEMTAAHTSWWLLAAVLLPTLVLWGLGLRRRRVGSSAERSAWAFVGLVLATHIFLFGFVGRSYATWYAQPVWALWTLGTALAAGSLLRSEAGTARRSGRWVVIPAGSILALALMVTAGLGVSSQRWNARWPQQRFGPEFTQLAERIRRAGPGPLWTLGAFDAGVRGYVALEHEEFTVLNLDGLVNNQAVRALEEGRYVEYVREHCDALLQKPERAATFLPPEEVRRLRRVMGDGLRRPAARRER